MIHSKDMQEAKRIAIVAHDNRKNDLIEWSYFNKSLLSKHEVIGIGKAGTLLEGTLNVPVLKLVSGQLGGYQQLGSMIKERKVDILIFLLEGKESLFQDNDIRLLHEIAVSSNIIVAPNQSTADFVLTSVLMDEAHSIPSPKNSFFLNDNRAHFKNKLNKTVA